jgi:hypothetical protein
LTTQAEAGHDNDERGARANVELLRRAAKSPRPRRVCPRWVAVMDMFALGSTSAHDLCRRLGLDPDEKVSPWPR